MMSFLLGFMMSASAQSVNLIQETKDIDCSNSRISALVDKRDRFILVREGQVTTRYKAVEFLDSGILLASEKPEKHAWIQLTPRGSAILIVGDLVKFLESECKEVGAAKHCALGAQTLLLWSSDRMEVQKGGSRKAYPVSHYGVHPNDGTYFIALDGESRGLGLLDFGARVFLLQGKAQRLQCLEAR